MKKDSKGSEQMMKKSRSLSVMALLAVALMVALTGCGGGGNGSSSAPPTLNNPVTGDLNTTVTNPPDVTLNLAVGGTVSFSHDDHVKSYGQVCASCHTNNTPFSMNKAPELAPSAAAGRFVSRQTATDSGMEKIYKGEGCGICHKKGGTAFDARDHDRCKSCHFKVVTVAATGVKTKEFDSHATVSSLQPLKDVCKTCHKTIVEEITTDKHGRHGYDWMKSSYGTNPRYGACAECHVHEAVTMTKSNAIGNHLSNNSISCQTCHDHTKTTPKRLQKEGIALCAHCHHARYVYGKNVAPFDPFPNYNATPDADGDFMPPYYMTNTIKIADVSKTHALTDAATKAYIDEFIKPNPAFDAAVAEDSKDNPKYLTTTSHYPHYSPQYDTLMGSNSVAWMMFTKNKDASPLNYGDSMLWTDANACVKCHVVQDFSAATYNTGHTFLPNDTTTAKVYGTTTTNLGTMKSTLKTQLDKLTKILDVDGGGTAEWFSRGAVGFNDDGTSKGDARMAYEEYLAGKLTAGEYLVLLGLGWNEAMLHGDVAINDAEPMPRGIHNYAFCLSVINNSLEIAKQLLSGKTFKDATKWNTTGL